MKRLLTLALLGIFILQTTNGVWTLVSFYLKRDYIAENLCVNRFEAIPLCKGQCYLTKELEQDETQKHPTSELKVKEVLFFIEDLQFQMSSVFDGPSPDQRVDKFADQNHHTSANVPGVFHPPIQG